MLVKSMLDMVSPGDHPVIAQELAIMEQGLAETITIESLRGGMSAEHIRRMPQPEARVELGRLLCLCEAIASKIPGGIPLPHRLTINTSALVAVIYQAGKLAHVLNPEFDGVEGIDMGRDSEDEPPKDSCEATGCECPSSGCDGDRQSVGQVIMDSVQKIAEQVLEQMAQESSPKVSTEIPSEDYRKDVMKLAIASFTLKSIGKPMDSLTALVPVCQLDMLQDLARKVTGGNPGV